MTLALKILVTLAVVLALGWGYTLYHAKKAERAAEAAFPPLGRFVEVDGTRVHLTVMGDGPDLVLLHGSSGNLRDMTLALAPALAQDYRVIIPDRPGHGYTDPLDPGGASISRQAALLQRAVAQLGAEKPIVLGHSYGGAVALAWAVNHPDNISALVPVAAASHPWSTGLSRYYRILSDPVLGAVAIPLITAFVDDARVTRELKAVFDPDPVPGGYAAHFGPGLTLRRSTLRANALQRASLPGEITALARLYPQITVPTEILHGTADSTVSLSIHSEPLAAAIPGAQLTRIAGAGHMLHHAHQDAVVAAIHRAAGRAGLRD